MTGEHPTEREWLEGLRPEDREVSRVTDPAARARDHGGHIHPPGHFCGSNCPMHRPDPAAVTPEVDALEARATNLRLDGWERAQAIRDLAALARDNSAAVILAGTTAMEIAIEKRAAAEAEMKRHRTLIARVRNNAESWHGPVDEGNRHAKALAVIAEWCNEALAGDEGGA